ncbi:MAG: DNA-directed RNA polymerase subunit RpoH/Rpb5 C-terminal domain-containing protein [Candidatus Nanoarchaeia archaeon]|nr:DNA-directed RNA polymerase subunit RpoH/Rpb5 C-terminal domain-containing protein [Candidatus Nanoarchaeia archaeon]MDD5054056.1 DNA-directed RNA polymerase subunit RpoH/Rpb5 C-terminal domain-containing protein [Candidatus Nanoarchaeia archaeon]MDD5499558.1 DNA-directed RNA polymerase subunit RpoH/Rpb5 C-terminal domain-containing protein [Candidatus Nanoarchaeia archaeon]
MVEEKKDELEEDFVLSHNYNPKFELLNADEIQKLFEHLKISSGLELPKINLSDPVCKIFKAKPNDIFKITRKSYTAGESIFYRVVIDE